DRALGDNPYETDLGRLVDLDKSSDFIGRAARQRIKDEGPKRKRAGIEISGEPVGFNMTKWLVERRGRPIGRVTSAIFSPRLQKNIGYAMVPSEHADLGTELIALHPAGPRTAAIVKTHFSEPAKHITNA